ncbi:hypothetical protein ZWY2020_012322 [Hordeum vulgare]|nr:hypothetical protein ZWY2020_012322 [Hordeum vulgare]
MLGTAGAGHRRGYRPITRSPSPHSLTGQPPAQPLRPIRVRACSLPARTDPAAATPDQTRPRPAAASKQVTQAALQLQRSQASLTPSPCPAYHPPSLLAFPEPVPPPSASPSPPPNSPPYLAAGRLLPLPPPPAAPPAVWLIKQIRGLCARTDCGLLLAASAKGSID